MSKSKAKGTAAETAIVNYLNEKGITSFRNPPQGSNDKGDVTMFAIPIVIEVKNCARMELSEWTKESEKERDNAYAMAGVVWHKKKGTTNPADWYVTMTGKDFLSIMQYIDRTIISEG